MSTSAEFHQLTGQLEGATPSYLLAELNDLLTAAPPEDIPVLPPPAISEPYLANYVAAMVELAAHIKGVLPPVWTSGVEPLAKPVFAVPWQSLRAHLLLESPVPFRRRNIFINSSIGARV